jgi:hypothetical protein
MAFSDRLRYTLYFALIGIVLVFLALYSFTGLVVRADKFTMFLFSLLFVLLLLPMATYIKIFDVVEIRKDLDALRKELGEKVAALEKKR